MKCSESEKTLSPISRLDANAQIERARLFAYEEKVRERFIHFLCNLAFSHNSVVPTLMTRRPRSAQVSVRDDPVKKLGHPETVVGQASEDVEAGRAGGSVGATYVRDGDPASSSWHSAVTASDASPPPPPPAITEIKTEIKQESAELAHDLEATLYGTYDEATNSITIIYPGEANGGVSIQECVQEIGTDDVVCHAADDAVIAAGAAAANGVAYLTPPPSLGAPCSAQFSPAYTMSPASVQSDADVDCCAVVAAAAAVSTDCASLSDGGYESHDSPCADPHARSTALTDLWHESFTELFPALA